MINTVMITTFSVSASKSYEKSVSVVLTVPVVGQKRLQMFLETSTSWHMFFLKTRAGLPILQKSWPVIGWKFQVQKYRDI